MVQEIVWHKKNQGSMLEEHFFNNILVQKKTIYVDCITRDSTSNDQKYFQMNKPSSSQRVMAYRAWQHLKVIV